MKIIGTIIMTAGLVILAAVFFFAIKNIKEANDAGQNAERVYSQLVDVMTDEGHSTKSTKPSDDGKTSEQDKEISLSVNDGVSVSDSFGYAMDTAYIEGYNYIGIIEIPSLGLSLPVGENFSYDQLDYTPCRYCGSYYTDDMVICGHNFTSHFGSINYLEPGASVVFITADGERINYTVLGRETVWPLQMERMTDPGDNLWDLTLFTCNNGGESRCAVRCARVRDAK